MDRRKTEKNLLQLSRANLYRVLFFAFVRWVIYRAKWVTAHPRARAHWLGHQRPRPRRLERPLLFMIITVAPFMLNIDQYLLWLSFWSVGAVLLISLSVVYRSSRRRYHWVRK